MEDSIKTFGKILQSLRDDFRRLPGDRVRPTFSRIMFPFETQPQGNLEPGSGDVSSRPSAEGSRLSLPPSSSVPTSALEPSPNALAPSHPPSPSLPTSGDVPPSILDPSPTSSAPPPPPSVLLASTSTPPPPGAPISPLEGADSVPEIVVSLPEANASVARYTAPATGWNAGFMFGSSSGPSVFNSNQSINGMFLYFLSFSILTCHPNRDSKQHD